MQIKSITVSAQRKVPHPHIDFANLSSFVSLQAELAEGEDATFCVGQLQQQAEAAVERHLDWVREGLLRELRARMEAPRVTLANTPENLLNMVTPLTFERVDASSKAQAGTAKGTAALVARHGGAF